MNDELTYVLDTYKEIIKENLGNDIGVSFFADSESYVDEIIPVTKPLTQYQSASNVSDDSFDFKVVFFQDFSVGQKSILTDFNICKIDGLTFIKVITPFTRERSYDFILTSVDQTEKILNLLNTRKQKTEVSVIDFPVIGLDFSKIKKKTIDFLLDEKLRDFCRTKHIKLKRGLIFEGTPGNGKSLSLRWLKAQAAKAEIEYKQFSNPKEFIDERQEYYRKDVKHIFVFEDFDAFLRERDDTDNSPNTILASILNTLDGIDEISDVVSIFTTNKVKLFDSAFIRPGRIDEVIPFKSPNSKEVHKFLEAYIADYQSNFKDIEDLFKKKKCDISYAVLKGICDNINVYQFNKGDLLTKEEIIATTEEKLASANKGDTVGNSSKFIM